MGTCQLYVKSQLNFAQIFLSMNLIRKDYQTLFLKDGKYHPKKSNKVVIYVYNSGDELSGENQNLSKLFVRQFDIV